LEDCVIPPPSDPIVDPSQFIRVKHIEDTLIKAVIAIDGGFRETAVREEFPSATITFFTFGPLFFRLADLRDLDKQAFIAPEDLARLKNIQRYSLVMPTKNVSRKGRSFQRTVRETLQEFLLETPNQDPPLMDALRWLLFRGWRTSAPTSWIIPNCPNPECDCTNIEMNSDSANVEPCSRCGEPVFMVDALRLYERIDEDQGAGGIVSYVMTTLEQIVLVHLIKAVWELRPATLREILFIKDGPLAFFGLTAPLSRPMRELVQFLRRQPNTVGPSGTTASLVNVVGLEKSGAFVEHAVQIEDRLKPGTAMLLSSDYVTRYIVPGDPNRPDPYGRNTYWGEKLVFKAWDNNTYVVTVATGDHQLQPSEFALSNLDEVLSVVGRLRCSMYDNALIPIALANKLVSLSEFPSARILENFARESLG
jgi:hypothetical protein